MPTSLDNEEYHFFNPNQGTFFTRLLNRFSIIWRLYHFVSSFFVLEDRLEWEFDENRMADLSRRLGELQDSRALEEDVNEEVNPLVHPNGEGPHSPLHEAAFAVRSESSPNLCLSDTSTLSAGTPFNYKRHTPGRRPCRTSNGNSVDDGKNRSDTDGSETD